MRYLDTSVVVAYYIPEKKSKRVNALLSSAGRVHISPLTQVEFCSAVSRLTRMKTLSLSDAELVLSQFNRHCSDQLYAMAAVTGEVFEFARQWISSFDTPLRTLDALHLGIAYANELTLVTDDAILAQSARHIGLPVERI
ncbi:MAG: type II toxin-antitoxin system VapC family toxin [Planctomycetota bacterium]